MHPTRALLIALLPLAICSSCTPGSTVGGRAAAIAPDLAGLARSGALRFGGRTVTELVDGARRGVHISAAPGEGGAWVEGVAFETGTIELELRGKDVLQQSFLGIAFAGTNDSTFEAIYLRPFNFRAADPVRKMHAVQYVSQPVYTWQKLRTEQPEVFENPVDPAPDPTGWVPVRVVVERARVLAYVGEGADPDLVVERIAPPGGRRVGLWVGNLSDGDFANLRVTPAP
jgi:hypothetical protein